jgi:dihydrofolate reductase/thymidylate synthase
MIPLNLIVSVTQNYLIGIKNDLLITSKDDLTRFYKITTSKYPEGDTNIVIMGYNTWISIPEDKKPLKNRLNIVITLNNQSEIKESDNLKVFGDLHSSIEYCNENAIGKVFIIGGQSIYEQCIQNYKIDTIYLTKFIDDYRFKKTDETKSFPFEILSDFKCVNQVDNLDDCTIYADTGPYKGKIKIKYCTYQFKNSMNKGEYQYLNILKKVCNEGILGHTRNGETISLFGERMEFDMNDGFPLLTTKKMGYKTILRELLWFISGSTSNKDLQDKNVNIWNQNSTRKFLDSRNLNYEEGDLGPVYGFQWRHSGAEYKDRNTDYTDKGVDQLQNVIDLIKNDPHSRRIIINSWNPSDLDKMALPPCHVMCQFNVNTEKRTLNCQLYQRSGDMFLGVPFNIASYAFLLHIISDMTRYKPGKLIHILGDTHIYKNHLKSVNKQLDRIPQQFPRLEISEDLSKISIDELKEEYFQIKDYKSYDKITAIMSA